MSDIYLAQGKYVEAENEALKAWRTDSTDIDESRGIAENLAKANMHQLHAEKAAYYLNKYSELNRQYSEQSFRTTLSDLAIKYETEKKEMRISSLEQKQQLHLIVGIAGVLLALTVWIIFRQRIRRERTERQLHVAHAVSEGEKRAREWLARDLHDGLGGMLSAVKYELGTIEHRQIICDRIDDCIHIVRRIARGMMPVSLQRYGIKAALEDYCRLFPNVFFHSFGEGRRFDDMTELTIYYCAYELVNNSFKHSGAKSIHVQLIQDGNQISLTIQDDGCGFNKEAITQGFGLKNISDRIAMLKGKMDITTAIGEGTEVNIELKNRE